MLYFQGYIYDFLHKNLREVLRSNTYGQLSSSLHWSQRMHVRRIWRNELLDSCSWQYLSQAM